MEDMAMSTTSSAFAARIALVGDRSPHVRAHARIPVLLDALRDRDLLDLDVYWIPTGDAEDEHALEGFDGVWLVPGSPYRSEAGALAAVRAARERGVPFLGTCGGFQHALLEYARNVCGLTGVSHGENTPGENTLGGEDLLITQLACSLVGHEGAVHVTPGSLAEKVLGTTQTMERYHCSYGVNPRYLDTLREHGVHFTGFDDAGDVRIAELADHPFFFCTLFQPELAGDGTHPHPIISAFAAAAAVHAGSRGDVVGRPVRAG
jgi:CTP synthase (UTP-ammonia lyase)